MAEGGSRAREKPPTGEGRASPRVTPIYKRLPHGPHRLNRREVILHQRARIHGAMIEAVATSGYAATSVRQVIGLAGVSRRTFYEHFASKEDCFLATFDLVAGRAIGRAQGAYVAADGCLEERLTAAFAALSLTAAEEPKAAALVGAAARCAGIAGAARLRGATHAGERLLADCFAADPLPQPVVRAIAGGLRETVSQTMHAQPERLGKDLAAGLLEWTLCFPEPACEGMIDRMAATVARRVRELPRPACEEPGRPTADERALLMHHGLRLSSLHAYHDLTEAQIAQEAGVSVERFFALFADRDACFLGALDVLAEGLLGVASRASLSATEWPTSVRLSLAAVLGQLALNPLHARAITCEASAVGPQAVARNVELGHALARVLTRGAPATAPAAPVIIEGIAGVLMHTVDCQVAAGGTRLLPVLSDYLAYVVIAPFLGADAAAEAVSIGTPSGV